jgi:hypothetical protein
MRARALFAFVLLAAMFAIGGACKAKGNGVGTAPGEVTCPATMSEGTPCGAVVMCGACGGGCGSAFLCGTPFDAATGGDADADGDGIVDGETSGDTNPPPPPSVAEPAFFMYCPGGTGATWVCVQVGDGGTFADAEADGESEVDGDVSEADAEIDGDAEAASDVDAASDADAGVDGDADAAAEAEADAIVDTAPEVDLDADGG